jgi:hypothetical protein
MVRKRARDRDIYMMFAITVMLSCDTGKKFHESLHNVLLHVLPYSPLYFLAILFLRILVLMNFKSGESFGQVATSWRGCRGI